MKKTSNDLDINAPLVSRLAATILKAAQAFALGLLTFGLATPALSLWRSTVIFVVSRNWNINI